MKALRLVLVLLLLTGACRSDPPRPERTVPAESEALAPPPRPGFQRPAWTPDVAGQEVAPPEAPTPVAPAGFAPEPPGEPRPAPDSAWIEQADVEAIEIIREDDPIQQRYKEALELLELDRTEPALELLRKNVEEAPADAANHWNLASVHLALEQGAEALPSLRRAVELAPGNPEYALVLAGVELLQGDADAARRILEPLARSHPELADVHYQLGLLHLAGERPEEAAAAFRKATALEPAHAEAWTRLAILHVEAQRWSEALAAVEAVKASGAAEAAESLEFLHGQVLGKLGRCDEAASVLRRARDTGHPDLADLAEGECRLAAGDADRALPLLEAAAAAKPLCHPCQLFLGDARFAKGSWEGALTAYTAAAAAEPRDPRSRRQAGKCLLNLDRARDAVAVLLEATSLAADDPEAWYLLARGCLEGGGLRSDAWRAVESLERLGAASQAREIRELLLKQPVR